MTLADDLHNIPQDAKALTRQPAAGQWTPRVTLGDGEGDAVSQPLATEADERTLLEGWHLDPDAWGIIPGTLTVNRWQQKPDDDSWLYQYKAKLIARGNNPRAGVDELVAIIGRKRPARKLTEGDSALVVNLADWQAGKGEGGGTPAFIERALANFDAIEDRARALHKRTPLGACYLVGMGDLMERCSGNYPSQTFTTDLTEREQARVVRRLLLDAVTRMSRIFSEVVATCVGGNHGENRNGSGKSYTTTGDNLDVGVFEAVYEATQTNPDAFGHVRWHIPGDSLVVGLDVAGIRCAWTHGHLARSGASPQAKQVGWWKAQAFGDDPAGARFTGLSEAQVLTTAHYHHFAATETHGRLWLQCPSMDGGSQWFTDSTGQHSAPGTLTYVCGPRGVREIEVVA